MGERKPRHVRIGEFGGWRDVFVVSVPPDDDDVNVDDSNLPQLTRPSIMGVCLAS